MNQCTHGRVAWRLLPSPFAYPKASYVSENCAASVLGLAPRRQRRRIIQLQVMGVGPSGRWVGAYVSTWTTGNLAEGSSIGTVACQGDELGSLRRCCWQAVFSLTIQRSVVSSPLPEKSVTTVETAQCRDPAFWMEAVTRLASHLWTTWFHFKLGIPHSFLFLAQLRVKEALLLVCCVPVCCDFFLCHTFSSPQFSFSESSAVFDFLYRLSDLSVVPEKTLFLEPFSFSNTFFSKHFFTTLF